MRELVDMGVDGILTGYPSLLRDVLSDYTTEWPAYSAAPARVEANALVPFLLVLAITS